MILSRVYGASIEITTRMKDENGSRGTLFDFANRPTGHHARPRNGPARLSVQSNGLGGRGVPGRYFPAAAMTKYTPRIGVGIIENKKRNAGFVMCETVHQLIFIKPCIPTERHTYHEGTKEDRTADLT